jgi:WD40 repeat protein
MIRNFALLVALMCSAWFIAEIPAAAPPVSALHRSPKPATGLFQTDNPVFCLMFSPDETKLFSGGADGVIRLWSFPAGRELARFSAHDGRTLAMTLCDNNRLLATAGEDNVVRLWDVASRRLVRRLPRQKKDIIDLTTLPTQTVLLSATSDQVQFWDVRTTRLLGHFKHDSFWINAIAVSPDGKRVAVGGCRELAKDQRDIFLLDTRSRAVLKQLPGDGGFPGTCSLAFSPCGNTLASGGGGAEVCLWNPSTGKQTRVLTGHRIVGRRGNEVFSIAFSPNGTMLASAGSDNVICVWDLHAQRLVLRLSAGRRGAGCLLFTRDGKRLVAVSGNRIRVWDLASGKEMRPPRQHP